MRENTPVCDRRTLLTLAVAAAATTACDHLPVAASPTGTATASRAARTPAPARDTLNVYSALDEPTSDRFLAAFNAAHPGVNAVVLLVAAARELETRIAAERASPKADVLLGGSSAHHGRLGGWGLLERYRSPNAKDVDATYLDSDGRWAGWYTDVLGFVSNDERLASELGGKPPATWDDLLDPAWGRKLVLPDPVRADAGYVFIATQLFRFGRDEGKTMDYLKRLHANVAQYVPATPGALTLVAQARAVGAPSWVHDILSAKRAGARVGLSVPAGTSVEVGAVGIIRGARNLDGAKALVDWALTREAGALIVGLSGRGSTRADVAPAAGAPRLSGVTLVAYDGAVAADDRDRILALWRRAAEG